MPVDIRNTFAKVRVGRSIRLARSSFSNKNRELSGGGPGYRPKDQQAGSWSGIERRGENLKTSRVGRYAPMPVNCQ